MPKVNRFDSTTPNGVSTNGHLTNGQPLYEGRKLLPYEAPGFKYRGGKYRLRRQIIRFCILSGKSFVEPYAGRANMTLLMRVVGHFNHWLLNDLSTLDFLQAVVDYDGRRLPRIGNSDIGGRGGYDTYAYLKHPDQNAILLMEPMLFWSGGRRGMSTPAGKPFGGDASYDNYRIRLLKAQSLLRGVEFRSSDASEVIAEYGADPENFLYVDPPYLNADVGCYKDGGKERKRMIQVLKGARCKWLLSEYRCGDLVNAFGEPVAEINSMVDAGSKPGIMRYEIECLYANYTPQLTPFDFGDSQAIMPVTMGLLKDAGGKLTWEEWQKRCPLYWREQTREEQWKKLARQANTYYDGKDIILVR